VLAAVVLVAGCGGGGGGDETTTAAQPAPSTTTSSAPTGTITGSLGTSEPEIETTTTSRSEEQSGDETPIATQALFTGRNGRITPRRIQVPPFIAVTVVLRSADGHSYGVAVTNHGLITTGTAQMKLPGLRAEGRYVLKTHGATPTHVIIEATAEPGP
jgi:hypothetical protein